MVVDTVLWLIIAAGVTLVWSGCLMTSQPRKPGKFRATRAAH